MRYLNNRISSVFYSIIFFIFIIIWPQIIASDPLYDFDMVAYMGVVLEFENDDFTVVHHQVYQELNEQMTEPIYTYLISDNIELRKNCIDDPQYFKQHLSFYRVKPLYTKAGYLIYKIFNFTLIESLLWVSILSFIGIGLLFYFWIGKFLSPFFTLAIAILTMMLSPVADLARDLTPDALSTLFVLTTMYAYCYWYRGWMVLFLVLAILARVDNVVLAGVLGFVLIFEKKIFSIFSFSKTQNSGIISFDKRELGWGIASIIIGLVLFLILPSLVGNNDEWLGKFSHTFSIKQYISELIFSINSFRYSHFQILIIIGIILLPLFKLLDFFEMKILLIIFLVMGGRLVLFPSFQDRFFIAYELMVFLVLTRLMWRVKSEKTYFKS